MTMVTVVRMWDAAGMVDGVQVREQYISVTRRRVIKGGVAGGSGLIYGRPTKYCSHSRD